MNFGKQIDCASRPELVSAAILNWRQISARAPTLTVVKWLGKCRESTFPEPLYNGRDRSTCACLPAVQNGVCPYKVKPCVIGWNGTSLAPRQIEGFVEQHNYKWVFLKQVTLQLTRRKWRQSQSVKLHAGHSAADGNRAVTSEVNRPAISPIVTVAAARRQRTPSWKSWVTQDGQKIIPS